MCCRKNNNPMGAPTITAQSWAMGIIVAIYHASVRTLTRSKGASAVAAAAYRSGTLLVDERTGTSHDYRRRSGVAGSFILLPDDAPDDLTNRAALWNGAESAENRKNSRVAREVIIALPHELSEADRLSLAKELALWLRDRYAVAVDVAIHLPDTEPGHDQRNHHAHLLFTTRVVARDGFGGKTRALDDKTQGPQEIEAIRYAWECLANAALERAGFEERIDRRTLLDQGIERIPQMHMGPKAFAIHLQQKTAKSKTIEDGNSREINYPEIDQGSRPEFNDSIIDLAQIRSELPALPLEIQIKNIDALIQTLGSKIEELEHLLPVHLLPDYIRRRIEKTWLKLQAIFLRNNFKEEARQRAAKRNETHRLHMRIHAMRKQIQELENKRQSAAFFRRFVESIEAELSSTIKRNSARSGIPRIITTEQFNRDMRAQAQRIRMQVPPLYRPNFKINDPRVKDNGGLARPSPKMTSSFNSAAGVPENDNSIDTALRHS